MSDIFPASAPPPADPFQPEGKPCEPGRGISWVSEAFTLFMKAPLPWIGFFVGFMIVMIAVSLFPFVGQVAANLIAPLIGAGVMTVSNTLHKGGDFKLDDLLAGFTQKPMPLFMVGLIYFGVSMLIVAIFVLILIIFLGGAILASLTQPEQISEMMTVGGVLSVLLAVLVAMALFVPLLMAYWFAVPLVIFHDVEPVEAMKRSFYACLKNIVPFLLYGVVTLVLVILAIIPLGLGLLVMMPVLMITVYTGYRDVFLKAG